MKKTEETQGGVSDRRDFLKACGRYAVTVPPAMTILLSTSMSSDAIARSIIKGNNGLGNGLDPQPPGNPRPNDEPTAIPGFPRTRG